MTSKLRKFLDAWFNELGFMAIAGITSVGFPNIDQIDESMAVAKRDWEKMTIKQKIWAYGTYEFRDHVYFNEREFITNLERTSKSKETMVTC